MSTLYELTGQYMDLMEIAEEADPDVLRDTLEGIEGEIEDKADNYAKVIRTLEGQVDTIDAEISRLQSKKKTVKNSIDSIKSNLERSMIQTGKKKFKTDLFSFGIPEESTDCQSKRRIKDPRIFLEAESTGVGSGGTEKLSEGKRRYGICGAGAG